MQLQLQHQQHQHFKDTELLNKEVQEKQTNILEHQRTVQQLTLNNQEITQQLTLLQQELTHTHNEHCRLTEQHANFKLQSQH